MKYSQFFPQTLSRPGILNMKLNPVNLLTITPRYNLPRRGQTVVTKLGHDPMGPKPWTQLHSFHSYLGVASFWPWHDFFLVDLTAFQAKTKHVTILLNAAKYCQNTITLFLVKISRLRILPCRIQLVTWRVDGRCIQLQDFVLICFRCIELLWSGAQMEP